MSLMLGVIGNKGGIGKSALARTLGVALARSKLTVCIADVDTGHKNTLAWAERRRQHGLLPAVEVRAYDDMSRALRDADDFEVFLIDAGAKADADTLMVIQHAALLIVPTGSGDDDFAAQAELLNALEARGIPKSRIAIVFTKGSTERKEEKVRAYYKQGGYDVIDPVIRFQSTYEDALSRGASLIETGRVMHDTEAAAVVRELMERAKDAAQQAKRQAVAARGRAKGVA